MEKWLIPDMGYRKYKMRPKKKSKAVLKDGGDMSRVTGASMDVTPVAKSGII